MWARRGNITWSRGTEPPKGCKTRHISAAAPISPHKLISTYGSWCKRRRLAHQLWQQHNCARNTCLNAPPSKTAVLDGLRRHAALIGERVIIKQGQPQSELGVPLCRKKYFLFKPTRGIHGIQWCLLMPKASSLIFQAARWSQLSTWMLMRGMKCPGGALQTRSPFMLDWLHMAWHLPLRSQVSDIHARMATVTFNLQPNSLWLSAFEIKWMAVMWGDFGVDWTK